MNPSVSVIVPIYNVERYLDRCIESILKQSLKDLELILVDDGSTDNSGKICDDYLHVDNRVRVIHKKNGGLSDARNAGIDIAKGKYIGFVDSDDYIEEDMYEHLYSLCELNNADISICNAYKVYPDSIKNKFEVYPKEILTKEKALYELLKYDKFGVSPCDKLYKLDLFTNIRYPVGKIHEDNFTTYKLISAADIVAYSGIPKYYHVYRENSIVGVGLRKESFHSIEAKKEMFQFIKTNYPNLEYDAFRIYYASLWDFIMEVLDKNLEQKLKAELNLAKQYIKAISVLDTNLNFRKKVHLLAYKISSYLYLKYIRIKK